MKKSITPLTLPIIVGLCSCGNSESQTVNNTPTDPQIYAPWASSIGVDSFGRWADLTVTGNGIVVTQRFRLIMPGTFTMGSPIGELGRIPENETQHQVTFTKPFWVADTECTQLFWNAIMSSNPSMHRDAALDLPLENATGTTVLNFITLLNGIKPNLRSRLPTEVEWEYSARGGTVTPFSITPINTNTINVSIFGVEDDCYISSGTYLGTTAAVKSMPPNPWGLYEVHGNVEELCYDSWVDDYDSAAVVDPVLPAFPACGVIRGGAWIFHSQYSRSALRFPGGMDANSYFLGFRLYAPAEPGGSG